MVKRKFRGKGLRMTDDPYTIIHTGDPYDFVIKNVNEPETYGAFHGDKYDQKSMKKFIEKVNSIVKENKQLKKYFNIPIDDNTGKSMSIKELLEEYEKLKAQLYCDSEEGVCSICKHHYLEKGNIFYISKCEKGHEECSKEDLRHCKDFEVKEL